MLNTFEFSHPEATMVQGVRVIYFATAADADVVATNGFAPAIPVATVPTLSPLGWLAAILALAGVGLVFLRRVAHP